MILADKIMEERKRNGWSQEELADRMGVSRQAVSKWESAGSVPDLQRIIQMAELFGVTTDYLLKDEIGREDASVPESGIGSQDDGVPLRKVSMEEASAFLEQKKKDAPILANATMLCILSPALLILLAGISDSQVLPITEDLAAGFGVIVLLIMVAAAVFLFITCGIRESTMEYLEKEAFETEYGVSGMAKERRKEYEPVYTRGIATGVVLCILAVVPLLTAGFLNAPDYVECAMVSLLLLLVAAGVNLMVRAGIRKGSYDTLLQEGEFSLQEKKIKKKMDAFAGTYWCLATAVYLGWSFYSMRWDITWVVWPVAGVLFAAASGIVKMLLGA